MHPTKPVRLRAWVAVLLLTGVSSLARAQQTRHTAEDADVADLVALLNTPVVSAGKFEQGLSKAPAKIVVVTAEQIRQRGYLGLDEVFDDLAGMDVIHGRGVEWATVFMRGARTENSDHWLLIWDGVIQNDTWKYNVWLSRQYPLSNVERIEVLYGPSSLLYGANAFGGIVNVILRKPEDQNGLAVHGLLGSYNTRLLDLTYGKKLGAFRVTATARLFVSDEHDLNDRTWTDAAGRTRHYDWVLERDGRRDPAHPSGYAAGLKVAGGVPHWSVNGRDEPFDGTAASDTKDWMVHAGVGYGGFELRAYYWYRQEIEDGWYTPLRRMHGVWTPTGSAIYLSHDTRLGSEVTLRSYLRTVHAGIDPDQSHEGAFTRTVDNSSDPANLTTSSLGRVTYYKLHNREWRGGQQLNVDTKEVDAVLGWEYTAAKNYEDYNTRALLSDEWTYTPRHDERNLAVFLNGQVDATSTLSLAAGLRYDYNYLAGERGGFGHLYTGRLAGILTPSPRHVLKLIYGQSFQAPSPWQKFATIAGERDLRNPLLRPERLTSTELVYEHAPTSRWKNSLSLYFNQLTDLISAVAVPFGNGTTLQHQNTGGLRIFGQELESRYLFDSKSSVYLNVTKSSTKVVETGQRQGDLAPWKVNAGADLVLGGRYGVNLRAHYVSGRDTINARSPNSYIARRAGSYVEMDLALSYLEVVKGLDVRVAAYNLFDTDYFDPGPRSADGRTYNSLIAQPGFRVFAGLSYRP